MVPLLCYKNEELLIYLRKPYQSVLSLSQKVKNAIRLSIIFSLVLFSLSAQNPRYTVKHLVQSKEAGTFNNTNHLEQDGPVQSYVEALATIWDVDDDDTTFVTWSEKLLLCFEGSLKNKKKEGIFKVYVIDHANHSLRYKIWEQTYLNNRLNGQWRMYALNGQLVEFQTFENDSLKGIARTYKKDGKSILNEKEYLDGRSAYINRSFFDNGQLKREVPYLNNQIHGVGKSYYESGKLEETVEFQNDKFHGVRKYYYPNGQLWIEQIYKVGLDWEVVANYAETGKKRDAGTLRDGNGTIIFYNEDGSIREVKSFVNGYEQ
jgi:antitoxin component YwqK of YwqJK toxin-antitoxin module